MSWGEAVNEGLFLTPDVKLRPDGCRSILFSIERPDSRLRNIFKFLYPQQAIILALFDGNRKFSEIKATTAYLFGLEEREASDVVESIMSLPIANELTVGSLIVSASEVESKRARVYSPRDFIESPRDCRRLKLLRGLAYENTKIFPGSTRTSRSSGFNWRA
jgi:hypothetical protein